MEKNSIPIIIPCHRVVSKDGSLGGYSGGEGGNKGIEIKKISFRTWKKILNKNIIANWILK